MGVSEVASVATEKRCPDCAEQLQEVARVCRFCGHRFDADTNGGGATATAGWYADPSGQPQQRYWDGAEWTAHYATAGPVVYSPQAETERSSGLAVLGLVTAVLLPFVGFVLGLVLLARRQDRDGLMVVMVSIAVFILAYTALRGGF